MAQAEANRGGKPIMAAGAAAGSADKSSADKGKGDGAGGSFLSRLFHRKAGEGDKVSAPVSAGGVAPVCGTKETDPFPTLVRKISRKEETAIKISDGLNELSQLMKCVGEQLDSHHSERAELGQAMQPLKEFLGSYPAAAEKSAVALEAIREEVVGQRKTSEALLEKMADLPDAIRELPVVGQQQVTLLQGVLRNAEEHNRKLTQMSASVESAASRSVDAICDLKDLQREALEVMTRTQQDTYREFDRRNSRQQKDLAGLVSRTNKNHAVLMVVFLVVTLCAVSLAAVFGRPSNTPTTATHLENGVRTPMETDSGR